MIPSGVAAHGRGTGVPCSLKRCVAQVTVGGLPVPEVVADRAWNMEQSFNAFTGEPPCHPVPGPAPGPMLSSGSWASSDGWGLQGIPS
jgi:hypothetical protein